MIKRLIAIALCVLSFSALADVNCDKQSSKAKVQECYQQSVVDGREALEEYHDAIMDSTKIPKPVKEKIDRDYQSFMRNIFKACPDNSCVAQAMRYQIQDMYEETRAFTVPR